MISISERFLARPRNLAGSIQSDPPVEEARQLTGIDPKRIFAAVKSLDGLDDAALSRRHDPHVARGRGLALPPAHRGVTTRARRVTKWSLFTNNAGVAMASGMTYSQGVRPDSRSPPANGVAPCQAPHLLTDLCSLTSSLICAGPSFAGELFHTPTARGRGWFSCSINHQAYRTSGPELW